MILISADQTLVRPVHVVFLWPKLRRVVAFQVLADLSPSFSHARKHVAVLWSLHSLSESIALLGLFLRFDRG